MRILVVGGDGYLGWPQALHLAAAGHDVKIVDNLSRRRFDRELGSDSLFALPSLDCRVRAWNERGFSSIDAEVVDVTEFDMFADAFQRFDPDAVVHFGEQRSAPYSMIDRAHAVFTQVNNLTTTLNILYCIALYKPECHLVKLGTMGEYGTPNIDIEEGFLLVEHNGRSDVLPFPKRANSMYHLSKVHDSANIEFCCRAWGLRSTDLNQGIVYGVATAQTALSPSLATRFDYDHVFGTALNRFCVQVAAGVPVSVYGAGGQTRGYIDIRDTMRCIELVIIHPPAPGEYRVFNQFTDQLSLLEIAELVVKTAADLGIDAAVAHVRNPRHEAESHYYNAKRRRLQELGLVPHHLDRQAIRQLIETALSLRHRIDFGLLAPTIDWRRPANAVGTRAAALAGDVERGVVSGRGR